MARSPTVHIYTAQKSGKTRFTVRYSLGGKRFTKDFSSKPKAVRLKAEIERKLAHGEAQVEKLTGQENVILRRAVEAVEGIPLQIDQVCEQFKEAYDILGDGSTIVEACRFYRDNIVKQVAPIKVGDAVKELLQFRADQKKSSHHIKDLTRRLRRFSNDFQTEIYNVTANVITDWLTSLQCSNRTRNNFRTAIANLFHFSQKRGYISKSSDIMKDVESFEVQIRTEFYSHEEISRLIENANDKLLPFIVTGAYAGLRTEEMKRMDWSDFRDDVIRIRHEISKTRRTRFVPIHDNLRKWLQPFRRQSGKFCQYMHPETELNRLQRKLGLPAKHNGLRHSYGTYRCALTGDYSKVASEMGNTEGMVLKHYREAVTAKEGERWFAIEPASSLNNIHNLTATSM